jgi:hypothetical protein
MKIPKCCTLDEYKYWKKAVFGKVSKDCFCVDCTLSFQTEMKRIKKCSSPDRVFINKGEDLGVVGIRRNLIENKNK